MPEYKYKCSECEIVFIVRRSITSLPLQKCPNCKGKLRTVIQGANFIMKDGGTKTKKYRSGL